MKLDRTELLLGHGARRLLNGNRPETSCGKQQHERKRGADPQRPVAHGFAARE